MICYFLNRTLDILGFCATNKASDYLIVDDIKTEDATTGVSTFEFDVIFDEQNRKSLEIMTSTGNSVLRIEISEQVDSQGTQSDVRDVFTIIETEINAVDKTIHVYAENAGLDLINDLAPAKTYTDKTSIEQYVTDTIQNSGFRIRENELEGTELILSWDSETTSAERLQRIAENFNCDLAFGFEIQGLKIVDRFIDIFDSNGIETDVNLYIKKDISNITTTKSIANIATALHPTGTDGLTLSNYVYDDGDFYINGEYLYSREAFENWQREFPTSSDASGNIYQSFLCESKTQVQLCEQAISKLKELREPTISYEVELRKVTVPISVRDRINVIDDAGELCLSSKIIQLETSVTRGSKMVKLGDYVNQSSGISERVQELSNRFSELSKHRYTWVAYADDSKGTGISLEPDGKAYTGLCYDENTETVDISDPSKFKWVRTLGDQGQKGEDAITLRINSSRGTVFKNNEVSTILTVAIYYGSERITNAQDLRETFGITAHLTWKWQAFDEETYNTILSTDSRIEDDGFTFRLSPDDVNIKATFICELEI